MMCPDCHGRGQIYYGRYTAEGRLKITSAKLCMTCDGFGIIHCCEGDRQQPDESVAQLSLSASAAPETYLPSPTV